MSTRKQAWHRSVHRFLLVAGVAAAPSIGQAAYQNYGAGGAGETAPRAKEYYRYPAPIQDAQGSSYRTARSLSSRSGAPGAQRAGMEVRLMELESQLRQLTGRLEESQHENKVLRQRLEQFIADMNYRIDALENVNTGVVAKKQMGTQPVPAAGVPASRVNGIPVDQTEKFLPRKTGDGSSAAQDPKLMYYDAYNHLNNGRTDVASAAFRDFIQRYPEHPLANNAHYWLGETFYTQQNYAEAIKWFRSGYQKWPKGQKAADSLLKLGMTLGAMGSRSDACLVFGQLRTEFPSAPVSIRQTLEREQQRNGCTARQA